MNTYSWIVCLDALFFSDLVVGAYESKVAIVIRYMCYVCGHCVMYMQECTLMFNVKYVYSPSILHVLWICLEHSKTYVWRIDILYIIL